MGYNDMGMMLNRAESNRLPINQSNRFSRLGAGGLPDKGLHLDDTYTKNQHYDKVPLGVAGVNISEQERRLLAASDPQQAAQGPTFNKRSDSQLNNPLGGHRPLASSGAPALHHSFDNQGPATTKNKPAKAYNILTGQEAEYPPRSHQRLSRRHHSLQGSNLQAAGRSIIQ